MAKFCCVFNCRKRSERDKNIPAIISHQGDKSHDLSKIRRERWLANIRRDTNQKGDVKEACVCSLHFHQGKYKNKLLFPGLSIFFKAFFYIREACGPLCRKSSRLGADQEHGASISLSQKPASRRL